MPNYAMQCKECEETWDDFIMLKDFDKDRPCPKCESKNTQQIVSPVPVVFKGGGWSK